MKTLKKISILTYGALLLGMALTPGSVKTHYVGAGGTTNRVAAAVPPAPPPLRDFDVVTQSSTGYDQTTSGTNNSVNWLICDTFTHVNITGNYNGFNNSNFAPPVAGEDILHLGGTDFTMTFDRPVKTIAFCLKENGDVCTTDIIVNVGADTAPTVAAGLKPTANDDDDEKSSKIAGEQLTETSIMPDDFVLEQNYPNPFNPETRIRFSIPEAGEVSLKIFNSSGQLVRTLVAGQISAGQHSVIWNALDDNGDRVASGVYLYTLQAGKVIIQRKLILMK